MKFKKKKYGFDIHCDFLHDGLNIKGIISKTCLQLRKEKLFSARIKIFHKVLQGRTMTHSEQGKVLYNINTLQKSP